MKPRHLLLTLSLVIFVTPALSGDNPIPRPGPRVDAFIPPADYQLISDFLKTRGTGSSDAEIHALTRTILVESRKANLDPQLIIALIHVESSGNSRAISRVGALGLMQLKPATARALAKQLGVEWSGPESLFDPVLNVQMGVHYLAQLVDRFGDLDTALAAYNWGPTRIARALRKGRNVPVRYTESVYRASRAII